MMLTGQSEWKGTASAAAAARTRATRHSRSIFSSSGLYPTPFRSLCPYPCYAPLRGDINLPPGGSSARQRTTRLPRRICASGGRCQAESNSTAVHLHLRCPTESQETTIPRIEAGRARWCANTNGIGTACCSAHWG